MKTVLALSLLVLLSGCYSFGNRRIANSEVVDNIVAGETTKAEVVTLIGEPTSVDFDNHAREKWVYTYTVTKASGRQFIPIVGMFAAPDTETHTLTILFDDNGVVHKVGRGGAGSRDALQRAGRRS